MNTINAEMIAMISEGQTSPVIIDEVDESTMYIGYCLWSCKSFADKKWLIKRITKSGNIQTICYANGKRKYNQAWQERATLNYKLTENFE
ncbi:MAG: hypothetical protein J6V35_03220 [Bacteroidales bacterium]|nr:hypothetical protein [Bacteroidales bacterium]